MARYNDETEEDISKRSEATRLMNLTRKEIQRDQNQV
jgi:hypothetical protein